MRLLTIFAVWTIAYFGLVSCSAICKKEVLRPKVAIVNGVKTTQFEKRIVKVCCPGYTKYKNACRPLCDELCVNSKCVAPNFCSCRTGYKRLNNYRCEPVCYNCKYGFCSAPGVCECYHGYEWNITTGGCVPTCDPPCVNGHCSDRNFCTCYEGYHFSKNNLFICERNTTTTTTIGVSTLESLDSTSSVEQIQREVSSSYETSSSSENAEDIPDSSTEEFEETSGTISFENILAARFETTARIPESSRFDNRDLVSPSFGINYVSTGKNLTTQVPKLELTTVKLDASSTGTNTEPSSTPAATEKQDLGDRATEDDSYFTILRDKVLPTTQKTPDSTEFYDKDVQRSHINPTTRFYILYALLAIIVGIVILFLLYLLSEKYNGKEYNIARLEKKKGVVKYSAEGNDVITAW